MIMGVITAGAGGTATVRFGVILKRRHGAGWHMKVEMEVGLLAADGRIANGLITIRPQNVARVTARRVVVAVDVGIRRVREF
jgi:hypothetical protein